MLTVAKEEQHGSHLFVFVMVEELDVQLKVAIKPLKAKAALVEDMPVYLLVSLLSNKFIVYKHRNPSLPSAPCSLI